MILSLLQTFTSQNGSGTSLAISEDQNYILLVTLLTNQIDVYNRQRIPFTAGFFTLDKHIQLHL